MWIISEGSVPGLEEGQRRSLAVLFPHLIICSRGADRKQQFLIICFSLADAWSRVSFLFILQELGRWCGWREPPRWQNVGGCVFVSRRLVNLLWRILKGDHMVQERNTLTFSSIPPLSRGYSHASPTTSAFSKGLWLWRLRGGAHSLGFFGPEALTGEVVSEHPTCTKLQLKSSFLLLQWNNDQFMDNDLTFNLQLQVTLLS